MRASQSPIDRLHACTHRHAPADVLEVASSVASKKTRSRAILTCAWRFASAAADCYRKVHRQESDPWMEGCRPDSKTLTRRESASPHATAAVWAADGSGHPVGLFLLMASVVHVLPPYITITHPQAPPPRIPSPTAAATVLREAPEGAQ